MKKHHHKKTPHHESIERARRTLAVKSVIIVAVITIAGGGVYYYLQLPDKSKPTTSAEIILNTDLAKEPTKKGTLKTFTGTQFREIYNNFAYPNTEFIAEDTIITNDAKADKHIQELAEKRGYVRRSAPVSDTFVTVQEGMELQERASQPWKDLQEAAKKDNININLTAAYRSADEQRKIFIERLGIGAASYGAIVSGNYDSQINQVLAMTAIPGYSRHHTGYTIDIGCQNQPNAAFENTVCFEWLSAENYKNAKTHGWIPSYPEGAGKQGPEPETWEYVWVGKDTVTE